MTTAFEQLVIANEVEKLNGYRKGSPEVGSQHAAGGSPVVSILLSTCGALNLFESWMNRDLLIATFSVIRIV